MNEFEKHKLKRAADDLVAVSSIVGLTCFFPILKQCPQLRAIPESNLLRYWDFMFSLSIIGLAILATCKRHPELGFEIENAADKHYQGSLPFLSDFVLKVGEMCEGETTIDVAIGKWFLQNISQHPDANQNVLHLKSIPGLETLIGQIVGFNLRDSGILTDFLS